MIKHSKEVLPDNAKYIEIINRKQNRRRIEIVCRKCGKKHLEYDPDSIIDIVIHRPIQCCGGWIMKPKTTTKIVLAISQYDSRDE